MGAVVRGRLVSLRPLRADEFDIVRAAQEDPSYGGDPPDEASDALLRARVARSGRLVDGWLDLGIEADGRLVGDIGARHPRGAFPPGVFEIGISLFDLGDRGRGYGTEAVALFVDHLFAHLGAARVQATTPSGHAAMRAVLERIGFAEEGTLRDFLTEGGGRVDAVMYGLTPTDRPARPPA